MRRWLKILGLLLGALLVVALIGLGVLYKAVQQEPEFYRQAIAADPARQKAASDQMLQRSATLASDLKKGGRWQAVFTAEQINGYLAVDLPRNQPNLLPPGVRDPRVSIAPHQLTAACHYRDGSFESILSLTVDAYVAEPNVLALRVRKARAGALPIPLDSVLKGISQAAGQMNGRVEWRQAEGDPLALITLPPLRDERGAPVQIETVRLGEGEIYVAGSARR